MNNSKKVIPPEWHPQIGVLLAWPTKETDWAEDLDAVRQVYVSLIDIISQYETVILLCQPDIFTKAEHELTSCLERSDQIVLVPIAYNDTWLRDSGPITVIVNSKLELTEDTTRIDFLDFEFNGWGEKFPASLDNQITNQLMQHSHVLTLIGDHLPESSEVLAQSVGYRELLFTLEGGSIDVNGNGLLLTTKACLLNKNRGVRKQSEIEEKLKQYLGVEEILWLSHGEIMGDDTDGHIDTLARFISQNHICYQACDDTNYPGYEGLAHMKAELEAHAERHELKLTPLPWPEVKDDKGDYLPATYANFLIINDAVIVPTYGCDQDKAAIDTLQSLFPNRKIHPINALPLIKQGGSIHCISMQIPKP